MWRGRLRVIEKGSEVPTSCFINLEDANTGARLSPSSSFPSPKSRGGPEPGQVRESGQEKAADSGTLARRPLISRDRTRSLSPLTPTRTRTRTGELFAQSPYKPTKANPNGGCEAVLDSSRYFVLTVVDATSGQKAYVGMGFPERTESFDFNVALQVRTSTCGASAFA